MAETDEVKLEKSKQRARDRIDAERKAQADERALHQATVTAENQKAKSDLDKLLDELPEPEQREVRMRAYLLVLGGGVDTPSELQAGVDNIALRLVRYMTTGKV